jgi:hypothetical protein
MDGAPGKALADTMTRGQQHEFRKCLTDTSKQQQAVEVGFGSHGFVQQFTNEFPPPSGHDCSP